MICFMASIPFQGNLDPEKGEQYLTAIVSLGWVALVADKLPDQFAVHIKNLVSRKIVKELLMKDRYACACDKLLRKEFFFYLVRSVDKAMLCPGWP